MVVEMLRLEPAAVRACRGTEAEMLRPWPVELIDGHPAPVSARFRTKRADPPPDGRTGLWIVEEWHRPMRGFAEDEGYATESRIAK